MPVNLLPVFLWSWSFMSSCPPGVSAGDYNLEVSGLRKDVLGRVDSVQRGWQVPRLGWQCWVSGLDPGQESIPASLWSLAGDAGSSNQIENTCGPYRWHIVAYHTIALISHASKVMLKIVQARLQQYMNCELPDVQTGFRKDRETRDQIANIFWVIEKAREFQKTSISALLTMLKPLCGSQ